MIIQLLSRDTQNPCYTDPVKQNLTITLDSELLKAARKVALDRDTSVNQLVRNYLEQLIDATDQHTENVKKLREIFRTSKARLGKITWKREDLYDRSL